MPMDLGNFEKKVGRPASARRSPRNAGMFGGTPARQAQLVERVNPPSRFAPWRDRRESNPRYNAGLGINALGFLRKTQ